MYTAPRNNIEARKELVATPGIYEKHLSWTDDGYIYFGEGKTIYRVKVTGGDKEAVTGIPDQYKKSSKMAFNCLSVSNDGTRAVWWSRNTKGPGNESFSIELAKPNETVTSYGQDVVGTSP